MQGVVRSVIVVLMSALVLAAGFDAGAAQSQRPTFRGEVARVAVTAAAETRDGRPVTDMRPEEFELVDSGKVREISEVRRDESPVQLAMLVDVSGSMSVSERRLAAREVAGHVVSWLRPGVDEIGLFTFDSSLREIEPMGPAAKDILDEFDVMEAWGTTSLFDAIAGVGEKVATLGSARRAVVALTDGMDNASRLSAVEVSGIASAIDVPVYVVLIIAPLDRTGSPADVEARAAVDLEGQLGNLARWTGGAIFATTGPARSSLAARKIVEELRHQYLISFEPGEEPGWHPIQLRTTRKNVVVRTRSGYVVGARPVLSEVRK